MHIDKNEHKPIEISYYIIVYEYKSNHKLRLDIEVLNFQKVTKIKQIWMLWKKLKKIIKPSLKLPNF